MPNAKAQHRRAATRARGAERAIAVLLRRYTLAILESEIKATQIKKAKSGAKELADLTRLLRNFGLVQMSDAASTAGGTVEARSQLVVDELLRKDIVVADIAANIRESVRRQIKDIVVQGVTAKPPDTIADIARRIRSYYKGSIHGPAVAGAKDWDDVSNARAALIARTESVQAHNTGRAVGFKSIGIDYIVWLAFKDGRSKKRHHERMHGEVMELGKKFVTPLGNRLRWPGDPEAPIKETANCRCGIRPATPAEIKRYLKAA